MKKYNVIDAMIAYADTSLDFSREVSCFSIPSYGIVSATSNNSAGSVEFDWFTVKDQIWKLKAEGNDPKEVYMLHTHPMGYNRMSSIDRNMVHGWCLALGIPIWFLVITEEEIATYLCSLDQETKKVERDLIDLSKHEDACIDLRVMCEIMYGLSKSHAFNDAMLQDVFNQVKESKLDFEYISEWNKTRQWNQITYMES
jgi:hypothetical protein